MLAASSHGVVVMMPIVLSANKWYEIVLLIDLLTRLRVTLRVQKWKGGPTGEVVTEQRLKNDIWIMRDWIMRDWIMRDWQKLFQEIRHGSCIKVDRKDMYGVLRTVPSKGWRF